MCFLLAMFISKRFVEEGGDLLASTVGSKRVKEEGVPFRTSLNTSDGSHLVCAIHIGRST